MSTLKFKIATAGENSLILYIDAPPSPQILWLFDEIVATVTSKTAVVDYIPSFSSLIIVYRNQDSFDEEKEKSRLSDVTSHFLAQLPAEPKVKSKTHEIPVCYHRSLAPDLHKIAEKSALSDDEVIKMHTATEYMIYALGFLPGFPFCGFVPQQIASPRLAKPRLEVALGSVGIAGVQTGIYPVASPGGWNIIGRVPPSFFPDEQGKIAMFAIGERVKFYPISLTTFHG